GMLTGEVINENEVEIGARGHLAPTELTERKHGALLLRQPPVRGGERLLNFAVHGSDEHVGKARIVGAGLLGGDRPRENARTDKEHVLLAERTGAVEKIFLRARFTRGTRELGRKFFGVVKRAEERRVDQRVHHLRVARDDVGKPRRGAEREREQSEK